jgi:hypothetical protein
MERECGELNSLRKMRIPRILPTSPVSIACPFFHAKPNVDCATIGGGFVAIHLARIKAVAVKHSNRGDSNTP